MADRTYAIVDPSHFDNFLALTDTIEDAKKLARNGSIILWQAKYVSKFQYISQQNKNKTEWRISYYIAVDKIEKLGFVRVNLPRELNYFFRMGKYYFEEEITLGLEQLIEKRTQQ